MFVIATVRAPRSRASFTAATVSRVSPDCEMPMTSVCSSTTGFVDPLARDVELDRDPCPLLDDVAPDDARVVRGAAGDEHDPLQLLELLVGHADPSSTSRPWRTRSPIVSATASLLVDLLEHERLVAALLGALVVPVELHGVVLDDLAVRRREGRSLGRVATISPSPGNCTVRVSRRARRVEARKFSPSPSNDERHLVPRAHAGLVAMDHDEREVPLELAKRPDSFDEVALVVALDEVDDGLGVGLGGEGVPSAPRLSLSSR